MNANTVIIAQCIGGFLKKGTSKRNSVSNTSVTEETRLQGALRRVLALQCRYSPCRLSSANDNDAWMVTVYHWNSQDFIHLILVRIMTNVGDTILLHVNPGRWVLAATDQRPIWPVYYVWIGQKIGKTTRTWCVHWYFSNTFLDSNCLQFKGFQRQKWFL